MPRPVSSTEDDARLAALAADQACGDFAAEILQCLRAESLEAGLEALSAPYRSVNPPLVPLDLPDSEIDELAFAEACDHVFRNAPSPIIGPIPR